ncbi:aldehyde dehydrogenase family protein, partial [Streptomyces lasiicapitis]|uniref:aldehyde dehydrogenase family protein n=1 Tax=Streptomyces lasiicapitis TaxID=1923961 RepID=UPI003647CDC9
MTTTPPLVVSRNPADPTETVAQVQAAGAFGAADAVERARAAQAGWLRGGAAARSAALGSIAAAIESAAEELAALAVREVGKPLAEARAEVARTAAIWRYYAQAPYEPGGGGPRAARGAGGGVGLGVGAPGGGRLALGLHRGGDRVRGGGGCLRRRLR